LASITALLHHLLLCDHLLITCFVCVLFLQYVFWDVLLPTDTLRLMWDAALLVLLVSYHDACLQKVQVPAIGEQHNDIGFGT
jgi:hypothetical protein